MTLPIGAGVSVVCNRHQIAVATVVARLFDFGFCHLRLLLILCGLAGFTSGASSAEKVGNAVKINVTVTGSGGPLSTGDPVHRNERVRANRSGVGQFQFDDGTKLAIGPNANVVIDKFVLGEGGTVKKLTIKATKGTFRFISGRSSSKAYTIVTPAGVLGVRGTATELQILPNGNVIIVQLEGTSEFCLNPQDRSTCRVLENRCDFIVAQPASGEISEPQPVSADAIAAYAGADALPFLRDNSELLPEFKFGGNECNLGRRAEINQFFQQQSSHTVPACIVNNSPGNPDVVNSNNKNCVSQISPD